jgi:hypothetical protein
MRCVMLALMAVVLFVLTGCATLITRPLSETSEIEKNKGISYCLPKRLHKVHLTATPGNRALEEAKNKLESAAALKAEAKKELDAAKKAREKAETEYKTAKKLDDGTPAFKKKLGELEADLATKTFEYKLMMGLAKEGELTFNLLVDEVEALSTVNNKTSIISIKIEPQDPVADDKNQLIAKPNHWMTRDDTWDLTTDAQGLLTSADNTSIDRTGDIVLKIAQAIAAGVSGSPLPSVKSIIPTDLIPGKEIPKEVEYLVDFSKRDDISQVDNWLCNWGYKIEVSGYKNTYPQTAETDPGKNNNDTGSAKSLQLNSSGVNGLVYRRELPYKVQVCKKNNSLSDNNSKKGCDMPIAVFNIQMPNLSPYSVVEFNASFFTTTKNSVKFDKGFLISSHQERPSELLGLVSLPAEFTKSYLKMLTEIISLKIDYSTKEADYMNALGKQIDAEKALKQKQTGN